MTVSVRQFKAEFPEFANTPDHVVQSRLTMAGRQVNASVWGAKTDDGIRWLTAKLLSRAPMGEQARLKAENRATVYDEPYEALKRQVAHGFRVI